MGRARISLPHNRKKPEKPEVLPEKPKKPEV